jgi:ABC-2 type transport system permease protein
MNATIAHLTLRTLLGRRRALLLLILPVLLVLLAGLLRAYVGPDEDLAVGLLSGFDLATLVPLLALLAGTGAIAAEIDDGSITYVLTKPINRWSIVVTKVIVAAAVSAVFAALPTYVAGLLLVGGSQHLALGYAVGALVAGTAYSALFVLLGIVSRNAVVLGLLYVVVWESLVGNLVPGAQALSVQQWSLAVARGVVGGDPVTSAVRLPTAIALLAVLTVGATAYAGQRLRTLRLSTEE